MAEPSMAPETPDVAETVSYLRRFAELMSNGYNAAYLHRAAELLETMTARAIAASNEEDLWRLKYETLTRHAGGLESECDALRNDIEGHLDITSSIMGERDTLRATLQARDAELFELRDVLNRERDERVAKLQAQEEALAGLRGAFDHKLAGVQAALQARGEECEQLRRDLEGERDSGAAKLASRDGELAELRLVFDRERAELQAQLAARGDELAAFRVASAREYDALKEKVVSLEAKRAELRSAFDRIGHLKNQTMETQPAAEGVVAAKPVTGAEANPAPAPRRGQDLAVGESNAVVPKATLRQARDQFEYLARQFVPLGDIASQVMCELGAYTMDLTLAAGERKDDLRVGEVARNILAPSDSPSLVAADKP
jgi:chromosome segregation ATPase